MNHRPHDPSPHRSADRAYVVVTVALAIPATLLLLDGNVPVVLAIILGFMLASTARMILLLPVRIYLAVRQGLRDRDSNR